MSESQTQKINHYYNDPMFEQPYFTYPNLYANIVREFPNNSHFVEVGSWKGQSSSFMAVEIHNSNKNIKFDCVDTWTGSITEDCHQNDEFVKNGTLYDKFLSNIKRVSHIITPVVGDSVQVAEKYEDNSLDFVFIDADHRYENVKADIEAWINKVKNNGIIAGHDYGWCQDVRDAVHDTLGQGEGEFTDRYGKAYKSYQDPWGEGCWLIRVSRS